MSHLPYRRHLEKEAFLDIFIQLPVTTLQSLGRDKVRKRRAETLNHSPENVLSSLRNSGSHGYSYPDLPLLVAIAYRGEKEYIGGLRGRKRKEQLHNYCSPYFTEKCISHAPFLLMLQVGNLEEYSLVVGWPFLCGFNGLE